MDGPETGHRSYTGQHTQGPATYREKPRIKKVFSSPSHFLVSPLYCRRNKKFIPFGLEGLSNK